MPPAGRATGLLRACPAAAPSSLCAPSSASCGPRDSEANACPATIQAPSDTGASSRYLKGSETWFKNLRLSFITRLLKKKNHFPLQALSSSGFVFRLEAILRTRWSPATAAEQHLVRGAGHPGPCRRVCSGARGRPGATLPLAGHELSGAAPPGEEPAVAGAARASRQGHVFKL